MFLRENVRGVPSVPYLVTDISCPGRGCGAGMEVPGPGRAGGEGAVFGYAVLFLAKVFSTSPVNRQTNWKYNPPSYAGSNNDVVFLIFGSLPPLHASKLQIPNANNNWLRMN